VLGRLVAESRTIVEEEGWEDGKKAKSEKKVKKWIDGGQWLMADEQ
jgi:hypothetical protein